MTTRTMLLLALLLASVGAGWSAPGYTPPVISVPLVTKAPQIDGSIEPGEWAKAAVLSDFVSVGGQSLPALRTTVFMEYDAGNFYLAAICSDPNPGSLQTLAAKRDGPVLGDDSLHLVIDTVGQRKSAAHLAVNAANVQYDSWDADASQDFKWLSATSRGPDGWSVEIALPFARGIGPAVGDSWLINVARKAPGADEQSSWAPVEKSVMELDRVGPLVFSGPPFRLLLRQVGALWLGENLAQLEVSTWKSGEGTRPAKLNARVNNATRGDLTMKKITVGAQPSTMGLSYKVSADGPSTVIFALTIAGPQNKAVVAWRSAPYPIDVPPVTAELSALEKALSDTLMRWAAVPEGERKDELQKSLHEVLDAWQDLAHRVAQRQGLSREEYADLMTRVQLLTQTARGLQAQVQGEG